jgi:hypothetical protein
VTEILVGANSKLNNINENVDKSSLKSRVIVKLLIYVESRQVVRDHLDDGQGLLCSIKVVSGNLSMSTTTPVPRTPGGYTSRKNLMGAHNGHAIPDKVCTAI